MTSPLDEPWMEFESFYVKLNEFSIYKNIN